MKQTTVSRRSEIQAVPPSAPRKMEVQTADGPQMMLVRDNQPPDSGIPLLDLGGLDLPKDIEIRLRERLWAHGIREYTDALRPGSDEAIAAAVRAALKLSVNEIRMLCQEEQRLIKEAGYDQ